MKTEILFFGQLTEITGSDAIEVEAVEDLGMLRNKLEAQFPALAGARYLVAVNQEVVRDNRKIAPGDQVALLPPFSGG